VKNISKIFGEIRGRMRSIRPKWNVAKQQPDRTQWVKIRQGRECLAMSFSPIIAKIIMKKSLRIYTYKITFEEVPYWYWGVHKERKFGKMYLGSPKTHKWMWEFYTPKIQILEFFPNTEEGWKEANLVEKRLIKFDLNNPLCLNENCGGCISLARRSEGGKIGGKKTHEKKDKNGKSLHALNTLNKEKDENGKSVNAVKGAEKTHEKKDENGKSLAGVKGGTKTAAQIWESTIDCFRGSAGNVAYHNKANGWDPNARIRVK
jgi:hypothetical protein